MAKHIQRKRFDHLDLASEQAAEFAHPRWKIPGITVTAVPVEIGGEAWLYVTQEGDLVTGDEPLLPDYEKVDAASA